MRTPSSTYRLQITESFDLAAAALTLPYLKELGVDWVYLSPLLAAESGSDHGYDVADHRAIDPARGRSAGLAALSAEARRLGMGVLVDIVPNHVGVARPWENEWWWHVLTHGADSPFAGAFDIDWEAGGSRVRLPVVAEEDVLEGGRIDGLEVRGGELHYRDQRFPLAPDSVHALTDDPDAVHARQHYELISWRAADHSLNYRRFFAVNTLVAIRVEDPEWFARSHAEIGRWFEEGVVDGLRVDHPDGLLDPGRYLDHLAELTGDSYVVVEKILALEEGPEGLVVEELPASWRTAGTTGYDVAALVDRLLIDPAGEPELTRLEADLNGAVQNWSDLIHDRKLDVALGILNSEVRRIAREVAALVEGVDHEELVTALAEVLACFGVYRSYLPEGRERVEAALAAAARRRPELVEMFDVLAPVLTDGSSAPARRFQQTSGMVMAKGVEDSAFYRWSRLTSLNEVGGDPDVFSVAPATFHDLMGARQEQRPSAQTAGTTHDTKRGEDVRARISVLAEVPDLWREALEELLRLAPLPDPAFGNLLWQAVLGSWPASRDRLRGYAEKAMREAGGHTTWTDPNPDYEARVLAAVDAAFDEPAVRSVVERVVGELAAPGWSNALSARLLALTVPGVPDVYQGSELWELSLVDPDNRRPVDFDSRRDLLRQIRAGVRPPRPVGPEDGGAAKLLLCHLALTARRDQPELFGEYRPLAVDGSAADHAVAFSRGGAISVATRLPVGLAAAGGWGMTRLALPQGRWRDLLTDRVVVAADSTGVRVAEVLSDYPVALLVADERGPGVRGRFDVWAPRAGRVQLVADGRTIPMALDSEGWWRPVGPEPRGQVDYGYLLDDDTTALPDPRSRWQPNGVHGLSRTIDTSAFEWRDQDWRGRQLPGGLIYEIHVGTFTPEGTLDAAIGRLPELVALGVTHVELMPVNAFDGEHGWGYDGVDWFAVHSPYGGPFGYRRFVDAAHGLGLAVIQDVVYNHLGPSGNYWSRFGPYESESSTGWGAVINLDGEGSAEIRRLICDNVAFWFTELHVDGLRLDAVHALIDDSPTHLLAEVAALTGELSAHLRRPLTLIAESEDNDPTVITPLEAGGLGMDAQWSDDFHHALHVAQTGETVGYYAPFTSLATLATACERGFVRPGVSRTRPADRITTGEFPSADADSDRSAMGEFPSAATHPNRSLRNIGRAADDESRRAPEDRPPQSFPNRSRATDPHAAPALDPSAVRGWRLVVAASNHDQIGNRAAGDRPAANLDEDQLGVAALLTLTTAATPMIFQGEEWAASTPFPFFSDHTDPALAAAVSQGRLAEFAAMGWDEDAMLPPQDRETFRAAILDWEERGDGLHARILAAWTELARLRATHPALSSPSLAGTRCRFDDDQRWFVMQRPGVCVAVNFGSEAVQLTLDGAHRLVWTTASPPTLCGTSLTLPPHAGALLFPLISEG